MASQQYKIEARGYSCLLCVLWDLSMEREYHEVTDSCFLPDQRSDAQCSSFTLCARKSSPSLKEIKTSSERDLSSYFENLQ